VVRPLRAVAEEARLEADQAEPRQLDDPRLEAQLAQVAEALAVQPRARGPERNRVAAERAGRDAEHRAKRPREGLVRAELEVDGDVHEPLSRAQDLARRRREPAAPQVAADGLAGHRGERAMEVPVRHAAVQRQPLDVDRAAKPLLDERSEEHTSELQSRENLVCRLLLEKK